ncbi:MAG: cupin domain-containing protein [Candidatus Limnocylindria bacterium]
MRIVRVTPEGRGADKGTYTAATGAPSSIFIGDVATQAPHPESEHLTVIEVHFRDGARNRLHRHTTDQILIITEGQGILATTDGEREVTAGDVAFIPAGEHHWHGAKPGCDMTHWSITARAKTTVV